MTQDTNGRVTNSQLDTTNESQEASQFTKVVHWDLTVLYQCVLSRTLTGWFEPLLVANTMLLEISCGGSHDNFRILNMRVWMGHND